MSKKICQSCAMPMKEQKDFGKNSDGSFNQDYCTYCFQNGEFTNDWSMENMIEHNLKFLEDFNKDSNTKFDEKSAKEEMLKFFPTLKRWRN